MNNKLEWIEKYKPIKINEIIGHKKAIHNIIDWINKINNNISNFNNNIFLLYGNNYGVGKTTIVKLVSKEFLYELLEININNYGLNELKYMINSLDMKSLYLKNNIYKKILLFETYSYSDNKKVESLLIKKNILTPIIIISDDISGFTNSFLKNCNIERISNIQTRSIEKKLKDIIIKENIVDKINNKLFSKIIYNSHGDLRFAINNIQAFYSINNDYLDNLFIMDNYEQIEDNYSKILTLLNLKKNNYYNNILKNFVLKCKYLDIYNNIIPWIITNIQLKNDNLINNSINLNNYKFIFYTMESINKFFYLYKNTYNQRFFYYGFDILLFCLNKINYDILKIIISYNNIKKLHNIDESFIQKATKLFCSISKIKYYNQKNIII